MKLGIFEVHRLRKNKATGKRELPWDDLMHDLAPAAYGVVAKVARGEVKNYLAAIAEEMGVPFSDPAQFLSSIRIPIAYHGKDCPGHTTGLPGKSCTSPEENHQ